MVTEPQCRRSTRQSIQARLPEHHTHRQTDQNRAGCKRQHVVQFLHGFADRELRHGISRDDDDDALRREGGSAPQRRLLRLRHRRRQFCHRPPIRLRLRRWGAEPPMEDHTTPRRPHTVREHQDQRMPVQQTP